MTAVDHGIRAPASFFGRVERQSVSIAQRIAFVGVLGMLVISGSTVADVLLRATLGVSLTGLNEIVSLTLAIAVTACLPAGLARRTGLKIDVSKRLFSPKVLNALDLIGHFALLVFFAILAWRFGVFTLGVSKNQLTTMILGWPQSPFLWTATALLVLCIPAQAVILCSSVANLSPGARETAGWLVALLLVGVAVILLPKGLISGLLPSSPAGIAIFFFCLLWVAILFLMPLGPAMGFAGILGAAALMGFEPSLTVFGSEAKKFLSNESLATLPLFLLMGSFSATAGLSTDIYTLAQALFGHRRGGLALATIGGCAGFGALTGSSLATAVTIGRIALPEMKRRGYADSLATGCVAAGGTLGQIVPPSTAIIIFAFLMEESIGRMFIGAIGPAIVAILLYLATVEIVVRVNPSICPPSQEPRWGEMGAALLRCWGALALFGLVIGGLYSGLFTETEAASVGAFGAFLFALMRGKLRRGAFWKVMAEATATIALIYTLILGAVMFSFFVGATRLPDILGAYIQTLDLAPILVVIIFVVAYLVLGTVMESFALLVITAPIFAPIVGDLGYDMIWWGLITVICVETGLISPPFGLNLFVLKSIAPEFSLTTIYRGVLPFVAADLIRVTILIAMPAIVLWLPQTMR